MSSELIALNYSGHSLLDQLPSYTGGGTLTRYRFGGGFVYTEGVAHVAETASAHWLIDLIMANQRARAVRREVFQVWTIYVRDGDKPLRYPTEEARTVVLLPSPYKAVVVMTDGNSKAPIVAQRLEFTDFPISGLSLWLENNTLMLPSER